MQAPPNCLFLDIKNEGSARPSLVAQIGDSLRAAIESGTLQPGSRLPSLRDLAAQLGVARGTVSAAYERLLEEGLIITAGAAGTFVSDRPVRADTDGSVTPANPIAGGFGLPILPFQTGVPAQDAFPAKLWARIHARAVRAEASAPPSYPDPCGHHELRRQVATYLGIARGIRCAPNQIIITSGFRAGLGLALLVLGARGRTALIEDPAFPPMRVGLGLAGVNAVAVPVDQQGMDIGTATQRFPEAYLAIVTPGQHAPTGVAMSSGRRIDLLQWAGSGDRWIIEDDYLSELQLIGRVAPALASEDDQGRVIHIGSFSKTMKPSLGIGFVVAPPKVAPRFAEAAACLSPSPSTASHVAMAQFIADGHYLRHLRRMKRLYAMRLNALLNEVKDEAIDPVAAGHAILIRCPPGTSDIDVAHRAAASGLSPMPLSPWYASPATADQGLMLGVTNLRAASARQSWLTLKPLLRT
ncbi:PLP-dependent aminotransferase family protein [Bradyrhizobium japonicum]|uniref:MocR-like pyridoxine biosynthesis transcription factor PdxR n=1 Tax=Bradyrhizobium japonicum TaxID=375 RepID=UPI001BA99D8C|nr:PLP-dependent aminotransferase family protein [Bradyrhizobium japonicum]MBR0733185.1 PLP-dependent aminotransferase family protein [Bradyrhizobium japonicum]